MLGNIALQGTIKNRVLISWLPKSKNISLPSQRFILSIRISRKSKTYLKILQHFDQRPRWVSFYEKISGGGG